MKQVGSFIQVDGVPQLRRDHDSHNHARTARAATQLQYIMSWRLSSVGMTDVGIHDILRHVLS